MALMSCKEKVALIYSSISGNTEELVEMVARCFHLQSVETDIYRVEDFPLKKMNEYAGVVIGTYTWGNGDIPPEMMPIYQEMERQDKRLLATGVVGTGDRFYPYFCGAVDEFRDMLYVCTSLVATLKIELQPQLKDFVRCQKFVKLMIERMKAGNIV